MAHQTIQATVAAAPFDLVVHADDTGRASTVVASGELDLACADDLGMTLHDQARRGRRHVHVDLSEATFLDATVLGVLVQAHLDFLQRHGTLVLTGVGRRIQRLLRVTGLEDVLVVAGPQPAARDLTATAERGQHPDTPARRRRRRTHRAVAAL